MEDKGNASKDELEKEIPGDISKLINPDEIIASVEGMLGHNLKDKDKETVNDILKSHSSIEDYLRILKGK